MNIPEESSNGTSENVGSSAAVDQAVNVMRLICMGLIGGLVCLSLIMLVLASALRGPMLNNSFMPYIYFGLSVSILIASHFGVQYAIKAQRAKLAADAGHEAKLAQYQTELLMRFAPLDGVGVFTLIGYIQIQQVWILILIPFLIATMILMLPTAQKFESWCQRLSA